MSHPPTFLYQCHERNSTWSHKNALVLHRSDYLFRDLKPEIQEQKKPNNVPLHLLTQYYLAVTLDAMAIRLALFHMGSRTQQTKRLRLCSRQADKVWWVLSTSCRLSLNRKYIVTQDGELTGFKIPCVFVQAIVKKKMLNLWNMLGKTAFCMKEKSCLFNRTQHLKLSCDTL